MNLHQFILAASEVIQTISETGNVAAEPTSDLLGTLGINWKLFIAQMVNFTIVLFIFWKWIVSPLGKTLTARQEKIESGLKNAHYMESEKHKFDEWKNTEMQKVRAEAEKIMKTATDTADKLRHDSTLNAQQQAEKIIEQAKAAIDVEKSTMMKEVKTSVAELVIAASEKIIKTKLDGKTDKDLVDAAIKEIS